MVSDPWLGSSGSASHRFVVAELGQRIGARGVDGRKVGRLEVANGPVGLECEVADGDRLEAVDPQGDEGEGHVGREDALAHRAGHLGGAAMVHVEQPEKGHAQPVHGRAQRAAVELFDGPQIAGRLEAQGRDRPGVGEDDQCGQQVGAAEGIDDDGRGVGRDDFAEEGPGAVHPAGAVVLDHGRELPAVGGDHRIRAVGGRPVGTSFRTRAAVILDGRPSQLPAAGRLAPEPLRQRQHLQAGRRSLRGRGLAFGLLDVGCGRRGIGCEELRGVRVVRGPGRGSAARVGLRRCLGIRLWRGGGRGGRGGVRLGASRAGARTGGEECQDERREAAMKRERGMVVYG